MPTHDPSACPRVGLVMAGGSGERFWPLSRSHLPKQLLRLTGTAQTLLEEACERLAASVPRARTFVATGEHLAAAIRAAGVVPPDNVWAEPCKRNTAGCLVYAAAQLLARFGTGAENLSLAVVTADHRIGAPARFTAAVEAALAAVQTEPVLATIGIAPTRPETGFGYLELGPAAAAGGAGETAVPVHRVLAFREKPDRATAAAFVASGRFLWNSGMFFFRLGTFLDELARAQPDMARVARELVAPLRAGDAGAAARLFASLEDISIDYALMEKARRVVAVRGDFAWDDVGSWDALARYLQADADGNATVGEGIVLDSRDCLLYNGADRGRMAVGVLGVEGLAVVVTEDAVLVIPKNRSQEVRRIVAELRRRGAAQL